MSDIQPFNFDGHEVRVIVDDDGTEWFVANDVCALLDIHNPRDAVARVFGDGVGTADVIDSIGRNQKTNVVNEAGLYQLIFQSRKPEAEQFQRWVFEEVLPQIRRTGKYAPQAQIQLPDMTELAQMVIDSERERKAAESRASIAEATVEELKPAATAWNKAEAQGKTFTVDEAAKLISNAGVKIGRNRLYSTLREEGWVHKRSGRPRPTQAAVDEGLLALELTEYDGGLIGGQTVVTMKGLHKLLNICAIQDNIIAFPGWDWSSVA